MRLFSATALALSLTFSQSAAASRAEVDVGKQPEPADSVEGNYLAAVVAGSARDAEAAARYFGEALRGDPRNRELLERAFIAFLASGSLTEAFPAAERLVARDPSNGLAQLALGVRDLKAKQYAKARAHFQKGGRGRAADITATLLTAWSWAGSGDFAKAVETVDRLKGENAFNLFRDYHAGLIASMAGQREKTEADRRMKATYAQERTTLRVIDAYGRYLSSVGDTPGAIEAYEGFDKLAPRHPVIRQALDDLKAGKTLEPLVTDAQDGGAEVLYGLGAAGSQQGDELAAMIYLQLSLYLEPHNTMALITLADILERLKQPEQAMAVFKQIPTDSPMRPAADVQIAVDLETLGRGDDAVAHLERIVKERPDDSDALTALGTIYRSRKEWQKSADIYTKAIERIGTPEARHWTLFYFRGIAEERAKQWSKAEADLKKALDLAPDSQARERAVVLNYLGYSWVDQGVNLDEAFQMLRKAVELRPRDGYIVDSLGWAYYRLGRYDDAVRELERAIDLKPSDPTINDHLGDAYWRVGRRLEARFQWNHARDLSPEPDELPKILAKIEHGMPDSAPPTAAEVEKPEPGRNGG
ncbi:tetratricopeptide repeat protein [Chelatococcus reniformis]|uniref:tetratricopeptide repeat protein n=1 Tax=Chelatococcus reniformis TaxID=1494448 RepID=UPI001FCE69CC|nr:tetratricopeptide repeat protein [Chelatococcus reniformis]